MRRSRGFSSPPASYGEQVAHASIAAALGLPAGDLDAALPVQRFSAGTTSLTIVPLRALDALQAFRFHAAAFARLAAIGLPPLLYVFCPGVRDAAQQLSARFFFEAN